MNSTVQPHMMDHIHPSDMTSDADAVVEDSQYVTHASLYL